MSICKPNNTAGYDPKIYIQRLFLMYAHARKSVDAHSSSYQENEERKLGLNSPFTQTIPTRPRFSSNEKKYDYQSEMDESREARPRTPSATEFVGRNKYNPAFINETDLYSNLKGKRISKNYVGGIGSMTYAEPHLSDSKPPEPRRKYPPTREQPLHYEKQNLNRSNYADRKDRGKKSREDDAIRGSFEKLNEEQILQKIGRINKLNSEINGRLQKILNRVSYND